MPEFPEVKTFINHLIKQNIINQQVLDVNVIDRKVLKNSNPKTFKSFIFHETIISVEQIGKLIVVKFSHEKYLTIHLRMEGKLFLVDSSIKPNKFTMIEILFTKQKLVYIDFRKFGTFYIYKNKREFSQSDEVSKLGLQPFDTKLISDYLFLKFKNKNQTIKTTLLDQSIIAGIGNIYADEILFACKINPSRKTKLLSKKDCKNLITECRRIMKKAIIHFGTTISTYSFAPNHAGDYQRYLKVHKKAGENCSICKTKIKKIKVNGRGTYYCPRCQEK